MKFSEDKQQEILKDLYIKKKIGPKTLKRWLDRY